MKMKKIVILVCMFLIANVISATGLRTNNTLSIISNLKINDPPIIEWNRTFGGLEYDYGKYIDLTNDGGFIITGGTRSYGAGDYDFWLIKTDSNGNKEWDKTFGGTEVDLSVSGQQTEDDGYIITGWTESYGAGEDDVWLIKTDSSGNEEWNRTFGGINSDRGYSVRQTDDSGYIITGQTFSYGPGDVWLIKTDSSGNKEWDKTFGGTSNERGYSVKQTDDGGYIITGITGSYGAGNMDVWLIKTDSSGNKEWDKTFGGTERDEGYLVQQTNDNGYIITGGTISYGLGEDDVWLIKTDSSGNKEWDKTFGGLNYDQGYSVQQTSDNGYFISGYTSSYGAGEVDIWLIKTDSNGYEEWNQTIGGTKSEEGYSFQQTNDGEYIIVGYTYSYGAGSGDVWLIKLGSEGSGDVVIDIEIHGGFGVKADIKNIGNITATDIAWSIVLDGGLIIYGNKKEGIIEELNPNNTEKVNLGFLFGIGRNVKIIVTADDFSKQVTAKWILGPLVLGV